jgi:hypothetical protein
MVGMVVSFRWLLLIWILMVFGFVVVAGLAGSVSRSHVHGSDVLTGSAAIWGYSTGPAFTIAGGGPVSVLQGFGFDIGLESDAKVQTQADLLVHV